MLRAIFRGIVGGLIIFGIFTLIIYIIISTGGTA